MATGIQGVSKEDLLFVEDVPKHVEIECPVCLQVMLDNPHLVDCCGHNYCESCIQRVKANHGPCPMCKESTYQALIDKKTLRIINGLQAYCTNTKEGCEWKGELKNLSTHLNKGKREGECQFEQVKCCHDKCEEKKQRHYLDDHERKDCSQRPYQCQCCLVNGTYIFIMNDHYKECPQDPVSCPNNCEINRKFPRTRLNSHLSEECPLQPVECMFSWAGCTDRPLRKDSQSHTTDIKHTSLLAKMCGQLKSEKNELSLTCNRLEQQNKNLINERSQLNATNEKLKNQSDKLTEEIRKLHTEIYNGYGVLPTYVDLGRPPKHMYTEMFGLHISVVYHGAWSGAGTVFLAVHTGKFDPLQPKLPKIFVEYGEKQLELVTYMYWDTTSYDKLPHDILTTNRRITGVIGLRIPPSGRPDYIRLVSKWN